MFRRLITWLPFSRKASRSGTVRLGGESLEIRTVPAPLPYDSAAVRIDESITLNDAAPVRLFEDVAPSWAERVANPSQPGQDR